MNGLTENTTSLQSVFTKNRTEELGFDVWEHFVIPPFYDRLDLKEAKKPRVIIGGRGCGKTMLLRYLSHYSMFSRKRPVIPDADASHIGLYWRADTQFANAMTARGVTDDVWNAAFHHMLSILLGIEILRSITSIAQSTSKLISQADVDRLQFDALAAFDAALKGGPSALHKAFDAKLWEFEMWVNNVRKRTEPDFLPGRQFLVAFIEQVKEQLPALASANYFVYLDEYENLTPYQQRIIHTYLKHSETPLIFNLAMKRNAFVTRETVGSESISDIADFRQHDLERYLLEQDFPAFAAEILFLHLAMAGIEQVPVIVDQLRDPASLAARRDASYRNAVLTDARKIFPGLSHLELADHVFEDRAVAAKLKREISLALSERSSSMPADTFIRLSVPMASVITPALLRRRNLEPSEIANELDSLERKEDNRFTGKTDWIHNNFVGCLLQLYEPHSRATPFYAGFETFCHLARGNIRHFLELCHKSINQVARRSSGESAGRRGNDAVLCVSPLEQAEAAREVSAAFLGEIKSFGRFGNRLYAFVLRIGSVFAMAHRRPTQSEPELSHFSIGRGSEPLSDDDLGFLREAVKWSVLFEEKETKVKDEHQPANDEYVLNPIYAPYFHITYRKRRRLDLTTDQMIVMIRGNYEEVSSLLRQFSKDWSVQLDEVDATLFSHLSGGQSA